MQTLTDEEVASVRNKIEAVLVRNGIEQWGGDMFNPYLFEVKIPVSVGEKRAAMAFNDIFHTMGVLPDGEQLQIAEGRDYCASFVDGDGETYSAVFNHSKAMKFTEDDEEYQSPVDLLFADLEERDPDHFAVKQYRKYKLAAGKTAKSILISCGARLAPFDIKELRDLMSYDELELDTLGDRKTALFLIMSDTDSTFNFVIAMLQSQLFNLLCDKADDEYGGKLPVHVRCLLDEFANIGQIPQFEKLIATIRSREISASIILQS